MRSSVVNGVMSYPLLLILRGWPGVPGCQPSLALPLLPLLPMPEACTREGRGGRGHRMGAGQC